MIIDGFNKLYEHVNLFEELSSDIKVGLYPGAFKPPHVGHFEAALSALKQNDIVIVLISGQTRGAGEHEITAEQSEEIWRLYQQLIDSSNLKIVRINNHPDPDTGAKGTVITATYDIVHLLNNSGEYDPTGRFTEAHPAAKRVYRHLKDHETYHVTLYAGAEDFKGRYSGLPFDGDDGTSRYINRNVKRLHKGKSKRLASASDIRPHVGSYKKSKLSSSNEIREKILAGALKYDDFASIRKNIPGDDDIKDQVIDILLR